MQIKDGNNLGPGNNNWRKENVTIGDKIIKLRRKNNTSSEVVFDFKGYGKYAFECEVPYLPQNVVLGIFLYADDEHEVDIEFSQWGKWWNSNCQFVIQKNELPMFQSRFWNFKKYNKGYINWTPNYIEFNLNNRTHKVVRKCTGKMKLILNLWAIRPDFNDVEVDFYKWT